MAAPLGPDGRAELRRLVDHALAQLPESGDELSDWRNAVERRRWTAVLAMVADSEGDVDAYIDAAQRGGVAMVQATDIAPLFILRAPVMFVEAKALNRDLSACLSIHRRSGSS